MSCCGKIKKVKGIAKGVNRYIAEGKISIKPANPEMVDGRINTCENCEKQTWFTRREYIDYLFRNARSILTVLERLEELPELEKKEKREGTSLFCMLCKCFIEGKARVEDEQCLLDKW